MPAYIPLPPTTANRELVESLQAARIEGANEGVLNADEFRDEPSRGWMVIVVCVLGIAGLILLGLLIFGAL
jgi:hypothetical protein